MKDILVGSTGFVGKNLMLSHDFCDIYHRTNINDAFGSKPELLVYAGVPSEMFIANSEPEKDEMIIKNAMNNIIQIAPKKIVLISTTAVYGPMRDVDENSVIDESKLLAYGRNRLLLEKFVENEFENNGNILRLPALFGSGLKKNFIFDYINFIPKLLNERKYQELFNKDNRIKSYYTRNENGFFRCNDLDENGKKFLKEYFMKNKFSALNFTDSRSVYQFYNLKHLWEDISRMLNLGINKLNIATEPVMISELYEFLNGKKFENNIMDSPFNYNMKTIYSEKFGGENGYIYDKEIVKKEIKAFVEKSLLNYS